MAYFLAGLVALLALLWLGGKFSNTSPQLLAGWLRALAGIVTLAAAAFLTVRGAIGYAVPLAMAGIWFLSQAQSGGRRSRTQSSSTQRVSHVETRTLRMVLDLVTGDVAGKVRTGPYTGRTLSEMSPAEVADLWSQCTFSDPESAQVLEAYLDRRHPSWRTDSARSGGAGRGGQQADSPLDMDPAEARRILGVRAGASADEITQAYKKKIKAHHPDHGGDPAMAARINRAKDILLGG